MKKNMISSKHYFYMNFTTGAKSCVCVGGGGGGGGQ